MKVEIGYFKDKRLKVILRFKEGKNFWYDPETDSYTFCGTWEEIQLPFEALMAIDTYNRSKVAKGTGLRKEIAQD